MSVRPNAPYRDEIKEDGKVLVYEGHDEPRSSVVLDPKGLDQPARSSSGTLVENGKFHEAAQAHRELGQPPRTVLVYEKIRKGIWSYNGPFQLVDSWNERDERRQVFKFKLVTTGAEVVPGQVNLQHRRMIPSAVKLEVWKRDKERCVICGAQDELHFDHLLPYSKGGTSLIAENVQLLCARHNLEKGAKIV